MDELMFVSTALVMFLGILAIVCAILWMLGLAYDKLTTLLKIKWAIIDWYRHKGKCKDCRNDVCTPVIMTEKEREENKRRLSKRKKP